MMAKDRCFNVNNPGYANYGGRGITMAPQWVSSFEAFFEHMGPRPHGLELDRIDNAGNYEPGNCRWATRDEQANNRRSNVFIEAFGKRLNIKAWAAETGLTESAIRLRLKTHKWPVERALSQPLRTPKLSKQNV